MESTVLRWFQQVADGTTVTEVSELEGISQPALSRRSAGSKWRWAARSW